MEGPNYRVKASNGFYIQCGDLTEAKAIAELCLTAECMCIVQCAPPYFEFTVVICSQSLRIACHCRNQLVLMFLGL